MDNDRYMQALRQRSAVMPYGMPVSSDPEASDAYGEGVVRGVAKNLRARAGDFINALRSPMETLGGIVETGKQIVRDPMGSVRAIAQAEALRAANTASGPEAAGEYAASFFDPLRFAGVAGRLPASNMGDVVDIRGKTKKTNKSSSIDEAAKKINKAVGGDFEPLSSNVQREMKMSTAVLRSKNQKVVDDWIKAHYDTDVSTDEFNRVTNELRKALPSDAVDQMIENAGAFKSANQFKAFLNSTPAERAEWWKKWSK